MAQQQVNINIAEVGFNGLDTVNSPITQDTAFAARATNCVIDRYGRIGARKGFKQVTATLPKIPPIGGAVSSNMRLPQVLSSTIDGDVATIAVGVVDGLDASDVVVGNDYGIYEQNGATLLELTLPTMTDSSTLENAHLVATDDRYYICSEGNEVVVYFEDALENISDQDGYQGLILTPGGDPEAPRFKGCLASHGRIWGWGHNGDDQRIYYSDLLNGRAYYSVDGYPGSTAGVINVLEYWPNGRDSIVGLASHNNQLIVFGRNSILVYNMGDGDPADAASGFQLVDTISNIGLVSRDAQTNIGTDVLFLDDTGVRSLGRTIQEKSSPIGELTYRVRFDIAQLIAGEPNKGKLKMEYDPSENIVIVLFDPFAYVLDMKSYMTMGEAKITAWNKCFFSDMSFVETSAGPLMTLGGNANQGFMKYEGYQDWDGEPYRVQYLSNPLTFGQPANSKFVKQIDYTIISQFLSSTGFANWGYDGTTTDKSRAISLSAIAPAYYGSAEYGNDQYGDSASTLKRYKVNTGGKGETFVAGFEIDINGNNFSLQEINIQTLLGRLN